jgi:hypothetical protein
MMMTSSSHSLCVMHSVGLFDLLVAYFDDTPIGTWVTKRSVMKRVIGKSECCHDLTEHLFWQCLKMLAHHGFVPKVHQRLDGKNMCISNDSGGKASAMWCKQCEKGLPQNCFANCRQAVRFLWSPDQPRGNRQKPMSKWVSPTMKKILELNASVPVRVSHAAKQAVVAHPAHFKGVNFTSKLLPQIFNPGQAERYGTAHMQKILASADLSPWEKANKLLEQVYVRPSKPPNINRYWIAPTDSSNATIALKNSVDISTDMVIAPPGFEYGKRHVWGFSGAFPNKWLQIQPADLVILGNAKDGFQFIGYVQDLFIWKPGCAEDVFPITAKQTDDIAGWTYGFTLNMLHASLGLAAKTLRELCRGASFQTQTLLTPKTCDLESLQKTLRQLDNLSKQILETKTCI